MTVDSNNNQIRGFYGFWSLNYHLPSASTSSTSNRQPHPKLPFDQQLKHNLNSSTNYRIKLHYATPPTRHLFTTLNQSQCLPTAIALAAANPRPSVSVSQEPSTHQEDSAIRIGIAMTSASKIDLKQNIPSSSSQ